MKYINDITEEKLKAGWIYEFTNQHEINIGESEKVEKLAVRFYPKSKCFGTLTIDNKREAYFNFEKLMVHIKKHCLENNLELRSMKRSTIPKHIISSSN